MMKKPPHDKSDLTRNDGDVWGHFPDPLAASKYADDVVFSAYGQDRLRALRVLVNDLPESGLGVKSVLDFGSGDGAVLSELDLNKDGGGEITLVDTSPHMLEIAAQRFQGSTVRPMCGSIDRLTEIESESIDLLLCVNTLGYLQPLEQRSFFEQTFRVLRRRGHLILLTGNELLDLFALNSGTAEFFERNFNANVESLLTLGGTPRWVNADRRNPLNVAQELREYGLIQVRQSFSQWHREPPGVAFLDNPGELSVAREAARDHSWDPNDLSPVDSWQALFRCSIFGVLASRMDRTNW